jgi:hypothetical protein
VQNLNRSRSSFTEAPRSRNQLIQADLPQRGDLRRLTNRTPFMTRLKAAVRSV